MNTKCRTKNELYKTCFPNALTPRSWKNIDNRNFFKSRTISKTEDKVINVLEKAFVKNQFLSFKEIERRVYGTNGLITMKNNGTHTTHVRRILQCFIYCEPHCFVVSKTKNNVIKIMFT